MMYLNSSPTFSVFHRASRWPCCCRYTNIFELGPKAPPQSPPPPLSSITTATAARMSSNTANPELGRGGADPRRPPPPPPPHINGTAYYFTRGGTQGGEGIDGPWGGQWWIENVVEELDIGREWYFDNQSLVLYYKPNTTTITTTDGVGVAVAPPSGSFVATQHQLLFNISGSQADPAHHIAIHGLTLRDTSYTYFEPHGLPSGGGTIPVLAS